MTTLIPDVLENIFSYLSVEDIVKNVCQVCTYWNNTVHESDSIWNNVVFDPPCDESTNWVKSILEAAPKLKHVKLLRYGENVEDIIRFMIKHCPQVRSLYYNQPYDYDITIPLVRDILNSLKHLTTVGLYMLGTPHKNVILRILSEYDRLETVVISECRDSREPLSFKNFAEGSAGMKSFSYTSHNTSSCEYDLKYLLNCKKLKLISLHLSGSVVCNDILPFIESCTKLKVLNIEERSGFVSRKLNLESLNELKTLRLCGISIKPSSSSTYENLAKVTLKLLSHLDLEMFWNACPNLQHVSIIGCDQLIGGDESFKNILKCENLRTVVVHNNSDLTVQTIRYVSKVPKLTKFVTDLVSRVTDEDEETRSCLMNCIHLKELIVFGVLPNAMTQNSLKFKVTYINGFVTSFIIGQNKACNDDYVV